MISIHAPREGGDWAYPLTRRSEFPFQSTPPARGATTYNDLVAVGEDISIHAPREGGDIRVALYIRVSSISIHAPREGGDSKDAQFYLRIFDK